MLEWAPSPAPSTGAVSLVPPGEALADPARQPARGSDLVSKALVFIDRQRHSMKTLSIRRPRPYRIRMRIMSARIAKIYHD